ncbi:MAG: serine/threonine protein kinase [Planctomycetia bacterium]|nr:serine/threonine protein kinase [Planctomycetia bacterium]
MTASATLAAITAEQFVSGLVTSRLLSAAEAQRALGKLPAESRRDSRTVAQELVKQQTITSYQARRVLLGQVQSLVLGSCAVQEELGAGGMGVVYKALHRGLNKPVAVKVLPPAVSANPSAVKRFRREALASARLMHPNLVAALDTGEEQGVHFLVLEFVDGCDLGRQVKEHGPLPLAEALDCVLQAGAGLACAHAAGIVHRDVKPHNLIRDSRGTVKVLDLGLARLDAVDGQRGDDSGTDSLTKTGSFMGSCDYIAPEQAMNIKSADHRADIYSLGCTLHFLLTGRPPYTGETGMEKIFAHREKPIPTLPGVPRGVQAAFRRMMAKKPEERFATMAEALAALRAGSGRRRRWLSAAGIGAAAAVLLGVALVQPTFTTGPTVGTATEPAPTAIRALVPQPTSLVQKAIPDVPEAPVNRLSLAPAGGKGNGIVYEEKTMPLPKKVQHDLKKRLEQVLPPPAAKESPRLSPRGN